MATREATSGSQSLVSLVLRAEILYCSNAYVHGNFFSVLKSLSSETWSPPLFLTLLGI